MRVRSAFIPMLLSAAYAAAQPSTTEPVPPPPAPPVEEAPPLPPPPPPPAPAPPPPTTSSVVVPAGTPITITITNNNTGNNNNTNTSSSSSPVTVTAPVTVSTPVTTTNTSTNTNTATNAGTLAPPSLAPPMPPRHPQRFETVARRWAFLGATADLARRDQLGARASLDLLVHGPFALGIAGDVAAGQDKRGHDVAGSATAYLAWTGHVGRFDVRAQLGLGIGTGDETRGRRDEAGGGFARVTTTGGRQGGRRGDEGATAYAPRAEAAVLVGLPLGHNLGIAAGPILRASGLDHLERGGEKSVDVTLFAGLRYAL